jgi:hypothetical protein
MHRLYAVRLRLIANGRRPGGPTFHVHHAGRLYKAFRNCRWRIGRLVGDCIVPLDVTMRHGV